MPDDTLAADALVLEGILDAAGVEQPPLLVPLVGGVRVTKTTQFPPKTVQGDVSRDSDPLASAWVISDQRGGALVRRHTATTLDRYWDTTCDPRRQDELTLAPLAIQVPRPAGMASSYQPYKAAEYLQTAGAATGTSRFLVAWYSTPFANCVIRQWDETTFSFLPNAGGTGTPAMSFAPSDVVVGHLDSKDWVLWAGEGFLQYDGTTWTDVRGSGSPGGATAPRAGLLAFWDDKLWAIVSRGDVGDSNRLYMTPSLTSPAWEGRATVPCPSGDPEALFVASNRAGDPALHCITRGKPGGVFIYDPSANRWGRMEVDFPRHAFGGRGARTWRGDMWVPNSVSMYRIGQDQTIRSVGFDRDWGLPPDRRGNVTVLEDAFSWLVAGTIYGGTTVSPAQAHMGIYLYDEVAWHPIWRDPATNQGMTFLSYNYADNRSRLWWGSTLGSVWYMDMPHGLYNPREVPATQYAANGSHYSARFDADWQEIDKVWLAIQFEGEAMSATERERVYYALNNADDPVTGTWVLAGEATEDSPPEWRLGPNGRGVVGRAISLWEDQVRGANTALTPVRKFLRVKYQKLLDTLFAYNCTVDLTQTTAASHNLPPATIEALLYQAVKQKTLLGVRFRAAGTELGNSADRAVQIAHFQHKTHTGTDARGRFDLVLTEL